jgi:hypothetical protein
VETVHSVASQSPMWFETSTVSSEVDKANFSSIIQDSIQHPKVDAENMKENIHNGNCFATKEPANPIVIEQLHCECCSQIAIEVHKIKTRLQNMEESIKLLTESYAKIMHKST